MEIIKINEKVKRKANVLMCNFIQSMETLS